MRQEKIKEPSPEKSAKDIESQKFDDPTSEDFYEKSKKAFEKACQFMALGLGSFEIGFNETSQIPYAKFEYHSDKTGENFTFYTEDPTEVDTLKSTLEKRM